MSLTQRSANRWMLTCRLLATNEAEKAVIERLLELESTAQRGFIVDAITAYISGGEPLPRELTDAEQKLKIKQAIRETMMEFLKGGNFVVGDSQSSDQDEDTEFVQTNRYEEIIDQIDDGLLGKLGL